MTKLDIDRSRNVSGPDSLAPLTVPKLRRLLPRPDSLRSGRLVGLRGIECAGGIPMAAWTYRGCKFNIGASVTPMSFSPPPLAFWWIEPISERCW
ncbi:hypothetical protein thsrh120_56490 [Rhizobium sp. No.120]